MALQVGVPFSLGAGGLQGSGQSIQGSSPNIQGSSPNIQGSSPNLQPAVSPIGAHFAPAPASGGPGPTNPSAAVQAASAAAAAASAAKAAHDAGIQNYIDDGTQRAQNDAASATGTATTNYNNQALNLLDTSRQGQNTINAARTGIAQNQIQSVKSLVNNIRQGLQSGAVRLGNSNALDSSAAGAVARIESQYGNDQTNVINNEAANKNNEQDIAQGNLGIQEAEGKRTLDSFKSTSIEQIGRDLQNQLLNIDQYAGLQGMTGHVDIAGLKSRAVADAQGKLAGVDQYLQNGMSGINPLGADAVAQKAYQLNNAGVVPSGPGLSYQLQQPANAPAQQLGGAQLTQLPLYLKPRNG
jgi:hypothetical protein